MTNQADKHINGLTKHNATTLHFRTLPLSFLSLSLNNYQTFLFVCFSLIHRSFGWAYHGDSCDNSNPDTFYQVKQSHNNNSLHVQFLNLKALSHAYFIHLPNSVRKVRAHQIDSLVQSHTSTKQRSGKRNPENRIKVKNIL